MEYANFKKAMQEMGDAIVVQARRELKVIREREYRRTTWQKSGDGWQPLRSKIKKSKGKIEATGKLGESLKAIITSNAEGETELDIKGEDYAGEIDKGRRPTRNAGTGIVQDRIKKWTEDKNIKPRDISTGRYVKDNDQSRQTMAFMITRSIHTFGFKGTNFLSDSIAAQKTKHAKKLSKAMTQDFITEMKRPGIS